MFHNNVSLFQEIGFSRHYGSQTQTYPKCAASIAVVSSLLCIASKCTASVRCCFLSCCFQNKDEARTVEMTRASEFRNYKLHATGRSTCLHCSAVVGASCLCFAQALESGALATCPRPKPVRHLGSSAAYRYDDCWLFCGLRRRDCHAGFG